MQAHAYQTTFHQIQTVVGSMLRMRLLLDPKKKRRSQSATNTQSAYRELVMTGDRLLEELRLQSWLEESHSSGSHGRN